MRRIRTPGWIEGLEGRRLLSAALLKDVNVTSVGSAPQGIIDVGGTIFFSADGPAGRELYRSDGTAAGTSLVKDILPGVAGSSPQHLFNLNGTIFFTADDGAQGRDLWKTDGTQAGTVLVKDLPSRTGAAAQGTVHDLTAFDGALYFIGPLSTTSVNGESLWRTDGTAAGTVVVREVPAPAGGLTVASGRLIFAADANLLSAVRGQIWTSDGTTAGTKLVKAVPMPDPASVRPIAFNGEVFFTGYDSEFGAELWKTDGTEPGTVRVKDINPAKPGSSSPTNFAVSNGRLYFSASDGSRGQELWVSDGTALGTVLVKDITPGTGSSTLAGLTDAGGQLYFTAAAASSGTVTTLWRSDGTAAGTQPISFEPAAQPRLLAYSGDMLFVTTGALAAGGARGLWKIEDPASSAVPAPTIVRPFSGTPLSPLAAVSGGVAFGVDDEVHGVELWTSDGTNAGTTPAGDINVRTAGSLGVAGLRAPVAWNGRVYFPATTAPGVSGLWSTDGTTSGTTLVKNLGSAIAAVRPLGDALILLATGADGTQRLWRSDGTADGTVALADLMHLPAVNRSYVSEMEEMNGVLYFAADDPADRHGFELWRTDGTAAGTFMVNDLVPGPAGGMSNEMVVSGGTLFFTVFDTTGDRSGLWKSDGTEAGTVKVSSGSTPSNLTAWNGTVYFRRYTSPNYQLWKSDGTEAGTVMVYNFGEGFGSNGTMSALNGRLVFAAPLNGRGDELWTTDGTGPGTRLLKEVRPDWQGSEASGWLVDGGVIYFSAITDAHGRELWRTDGTADGTVRLTDMTPTIFNGPVPLGVVGGRLYFSATDGASGTELWSLDTVAAPGTPAAAPSLVRDVRPGSANSSPAGFTPLGGRVLFWADDGDHGAEPWVMPPPAEVVGRHVFYNRSAFDGNDAGVSAADDAAVDSGKAALLPGAAGSFANVTSYARGVNGIMVDLDNLPASAALTADDFTFRFGTRGDPAEWSAAPALSAVSVRRGAGVNGSDRVTLVWSDNAVRNAWLQVSVKANTNTGLSSADVFSFGNLPGETGDVASAMRVSAADQLAVRQSMYSRSPIAGAHDFDRNGRVDVHDLALARRSLGRDLVSLPPAPVAQVVPVSVAAPPNEGRSRTRRAAYELLQQA